MFSRHRWDKEMSDYLEVELITQLSRIVNALEKLEKATEYNTNEICKSLNWIQQVIEQGQ